MVKTEIIEVSTKKHQKEFIDYLNFRENYKKKV